MSWQQDLRPQQDFYGARVNTTRAPLVPVYQARPASTIRRGRQSETSHTPAATTQMGGIVIVPTLERSEDARKLEEKDFAGYLLAHFNEGVTKGTNFHRPKHGVVTYLTWDELKAVAEHWKVDIKLD